MAKTKSFRELVQRHVKSDKKFAEALLREAVDALLSGDLETGKTILRLRNSPIPKAASREATFRPCSAARSRR